jgi:hypothetical protein
MERGWCDKEFCRIRVIDRIIANHVNGIFFCVFKCNATGIKNSMGFLTFKNFISIPALITFYYFGAVIFPFFMWFFSSWIIRKYQLLGEAHDNGKEILRDILNSQQKIKIIAAFLIAFIFMELFWRMLFEYLIAFIQMRDALLQ